MNEGEMKIVLPWNLMLDMAMELIRQGDKPLKAVESADKAFRRLNELAVMYELASAGDQPE